MDHKALIFQNASGEGPGILADCLQNRGWDREDILLYRGDNISEKWRGHSLLIVMGGPMNVYEEDAYPFLRQETEVIRKAIRTGLPVMGFCLGVQLMAKALGARVKKGHKKEIGWYSVHLTEKGLQDPTLKSFPEESVVFQWHADTFELPKEATRIFSSENYPNQAIRIGDMNYGFQFHFEITADMIAEWIKNGMDEIAEMQVEDLNETIIREADIYLPKAHSLAESFFNNYLEIIEVREG